MNSKNKQGRKDDVGDVGMEMEMEMEERETGKGATVKQDDGPGWSVLVGLG